MATSDHHMPDMDVQKISLLPMREPQGQDGLNGRPVQRSRGIQNDDKDIERPSMPHIRRKGTFRNESLIAVMCQWTVEHQIGKFSIFRGRKNNPIDLRPRYLDQPAFAPHLDTSLLPTSTADHKKILPDIILQSFDGQICCGMGRSLLGALLYRGSNGFTSSDARLCAPARCTVPRCHKEEREDQVC